MPSSLFSLSQNVALHKVIVSSNEIDTPITIDSNNPDGVTSKHCILYSLFYYISVPHVITLYNGGASFSITLNQGAGIQSSENPIFFSGMDEPLQIACSTEAEILCGISYDSKYIGR